MLKEKAKRKMRQKEGQEKLCKNLWALPNGNNWLNNQNLKYNLSVKAKLYKVDFAREILKLYNEMLCIFFQIEKHDIWNKSIIHKTD